VVDLPSAASEDRCDRTLAAVRRLRLVVGVVGVVGGGEQAGVVNPTGLVADDVRSPGLALDLVPILRAFVQPSARL
jgi:hypothetical protein